MFRRKSVYALVAVIALLLALVGFAAAQDAQSPFLGFTFEAARNGIQVQDVVPDSPAAQAGIQPGDLISAINGRRVTAGNVRGVLRNYNVGDTLTLDVQRGDQTLNLDVTLAARPEALQGQPDRPRIFDRPFLGVSLEDTAQGVVIREITPDSAADKAGLQVGDIIEKIGETTVENVNAAREAIASMNVGDTVTIQVNRDGETVTVDATLEAAPQSELPGMPLPFSGTNFQYNSQDQSWTIGDLSEDNPLYAAGLRSGDVIKQFNGQAYDPSGLHGFLMNLEDTATVTLSVERNGETLEIEAPVEAVDELDMFRFGDNFGAPDFGMPFEMPFGMPGLGNGRLGVEFQMLDEQVAQERNIDQTEGALIISVSPDSPAEKAGLVADDIITAVNGEPVDAERTLRDRLLAYEPGDTVTLTVQRGSETLDVQATLDEQQSQGIMPFFGDPNGFHFNIPIPTQPEEPKADM